MVVEVVGNRASSTRVHHSRVLLKPNVAAFRALSQSGVCLSQREAEWGPARVCLSLPNKIMFLKGACLAGCLSILGSDK